MSFGFKDLKSGYESFEDVIDKNLNLNITPDMPKPPNAKKARKQAKKRRDLPRVIMALQRRLLRNANPPGRKSTVFTSPRGIV